MIHNLENKKVLVRVDFNVPLDSDFNITDDSRMKAAIPTLKHLLDNGASLIIMSHRGRPLKNLNTDGTINIDQFSLKYLVTRLEELLSQKINFANLLNKEETERKANQLNAGDILLLENTRFHQGEKTGDPAFSKWLASLGNAFVNDAFGTSHRAHASTTIIANYFEKDNKSVGFLIEKELFEANKLMTNPESPFTAIIGGAKVSDKILLLKKLIGKVDNLLIGGGMCYTFIKARGGAVGNSLVEKSKLDLALELIALAVDSKTKLHLPVDNIVADQFSAEANTASCPTNAIPEGWMGLDIGDKAIKNYTNIIHQSKTIFWNGPMGVFEFKAFAEGTKSVAEAVAKATSQGAYSSIGGGDSVAAINKFGFSDQVSFMSTGGGAMLKLLEGSSLPGIEAVES